MADKDLVIHLPMDGNSDSDALRDRSGSNIGAKTHGNPKWKRSGGHDGKGAFEFDGNDDISVEGRFPLRSSYTKTAWIYWIGNGGREAGNNIISGDSNKGGHALWAPKIYGNRLSAGHNSHWKTVQDKSPLKRNRWYFVALTYDRSSGEMILYKDAVKVSRAKVGSADRDVTDPTISIGSFGHKNGWMIQGVVDDVRIYKRALSADEIAGIFKKGGIIAKQSKSGQASPKPKPQEKRVKGFVVWESNRTGQWELYRANTDGSGLKRLTQLAKIYRIPYDDYLRPRISPDGKTVLFGYGRRKAPVEVWIVPSNGGKSRKLTVGNPLNWSSDSKRIYFVRNRQIWQYELSTGKESLLNKVKVPVDGRSGNMVGDIRPDLKAAVFRTGKSNEYFVFGKGKTIKRMGGCEPAFSSDGRYIYWVQGPRDFRVWDSKSNKERTLLGKPPVKRWNYTYFPRVSSDNRWIVYGASPNQHNHSSSDYEIFLQELKNWRPVGKPIRLSRDKRTDRWGELWAGK
jgi:hypothetical protein